MILSGLSGVIYMGVNKIFNYNFFLFFSPVFVLYLSIHPQIFWWYDHSYRVRLHKSFRDIWFLDHTHRQRNLQLIVKYKPIQFGIISFLLLCLQSRSCLGWVGTWHPSFCYWHCLCCTAFLWR